LMVRFQREDDDQAAEGAAMEEGNEVSIQGNLTNGTATTPPPTPQPSITGDWAGTVAWLAVQHMTAGNTVERVAANQALTLSISDAGAVSGTGFGCTVTGTLTALPKKDGADDDPNEQEGPDDNPHGGNSGSGDSGSGDSGSGNSRPGHGGFTFGGSITLAGCTQPLFNGVFDEARARPLGAAGLVIDFERTATDADGSLHVEIEGTLQAAAPTP